MSSSFLLPHFAARCLSGLLVDPGQPMRRSEGASKGLKQAAESMAGGTLAICRRQQARPCTWNALDLSWIFDPRRCTLEYPAQYLNITSHAGQIFVRHGIGAWIYLASPGWMCLAVSLSSIYLNWCSSLRLCERSRGRLGSCIRETETSSGPHASS